ncbi:hypothetical protein SteCoe_10369 [Stentor coeruleus]|uniref:Uncharacterized protein n=1 Tax=Stentor coeruleus TaxID=5963 RepID=A0A1R2CFK9_9CILI|nr:hypothetical protein SteCoe_10369 [Stentor coeruleus]
MEARQKNSKKLRFVNFVQTNSKKLRLVNFAQTNAERYGITENIMKYCKIKVVDYSGNSYLKIKFPNDPSYQRLKSWRKCYFTDTGNSSIFDALLCNCALGKDDIGLNESKIFYNYNYSLNCNDRIFTFNIRPFSTFVQLEVKLKRETFIENGFLQTNRRGNQYLNALMFSIKRNDFTETSYNNKTPLVIKSPEKYLHFDRFSTIFPCEFSNMCFNYLRTLDLGLENFDNQGNRCYCKICFPDIWINSQVIGNETYIIPRGWMRFGIKTPFMFTNVNHIWRSWPNAFHGTNPTAIRSILQDKTLLTPDDFTSEGKRVGVKIRPDQRGTYYVSPHICYASHSWYSNIQKLDHRNGKPRYAQLVFAVKIRPGCYKKKEETEGGAKKLFDDYSIIKENEIEWYSKTRGSVLLYGLLIRVFGETKKKEIVRLS